MSGTFDERMMDRALREARKGRPSPNPHVGAVVARGQSVIGVGYHARAGLAHAEVVALEAAGTKARGSTLYVTFEPCNHFGRTPPCTDAILRAGVARVVIGCADPAPHVPGACEKLRAAGVEVVLGVRQAQARAQTADFTKHITTGLPYVTLKAAVTLDGRMATRTGQSQWITGEPARREAHRLRAASGAVLVGVGTVVADDPELTVRLVRGKTPVRMVLDTGLRTPPGSRLLASRLRSEVWLMHGPGANEERRAALGAAGAELVEVPVHAGRVDLEAALRVIAARGVVRVLVEGGPTLHGSLLAGGWADAAQVFVAPRILGDPQARPLAYGPDVSQIADGWRLKEPTIRRLGEDVLVAGDLIRGARPDTRG